jgi:hypothetical protein
MLNLSSLAPTFNRYENDEFSRKVLEAPSPGRLVQGYFASDAPGDGG